MSNDLADLLGTAVPEPARYLNPDAVLRAARHRRTVRRSGVVGAVVAVTAFAAVVPLALHGSPETAGPSSGGPEPLTLSALDLAGSLPQDVSGMVSPSQGEGPYTGVLAATVDGDRIYLAETTDDELCLVAAKPAPGGGASTCNQRSALMTSGVVLAYTPAAGKPLTVVVVAPDGYETASAESRSAQVVANVAVLTLPDAAAITLSGPHVRSVTLQLSESPVSGTVQTPQPSASRPARERLEQQGAR
jgi:hypothetical protein